MTVEWTDEALKSLAEIHFYISEESPTAADRTIRRLFARVEQLDSFPLSGRIVPEFAADQVRELIEAPYRVWYRVLPAGAQVLAVVHGARDVR